ncbi:MAG: aryl-sulfate sulfotransferase [Agriterribacter sp.]
MKNKKETESKLYDFNTSQLPFWLKDAFVVLNPKPENVPSVFQDGYIMLYQREEPGTLYFINYKGEIVWYHRVENTGFKVAHFTDKQTILSILGDSKYETSYGNQILELSLTGDTLLNLKKGEKDFNQTVHHEVILTPDNNIATLTVEERVVDLSEAGGGKNDTIKTDGIIILNRDRKKLWQWTVFDVLNPLKEKNILKEKKDWMHANSLTYAPDGNFIISFYNAGQIWKIDSKSGKLIWKFGKGGDFAIHGNIPEQYHAVHYVNDSTIMFFDNGTSAKVSHVFKFKLDENNKQAIPILDISLPKDAFNERMGSTYMVGDSAVLTCLSKRNLIILSNVKGNYLWVMNTSGISPYRAEFITPDQVKPFIDRLP